MSGTIEEKLEAVIPEQAKAHPAWLRLEDQLAWYDAASGRNQSWYKRLRVTQVVLATAIPLISLIPQAWTRWASAVFGGAIAVLEAVQQLNHFGTLWIEYRSTAEHLKHEKFLFLSESGPYRDLDKQDAFRLLAERVEERVSTEHARWVRASEEDLRQDKSTPAAATQRTPPAGPR